MPTVTPLSDRPECPKCGTQMTLACVWPEGEGEDLRTFEFDPRMLEALAASARVNLRSEASALDEDVEVKSGKAGLSTFCPLSTR
jgi:hypothetical protein